MHRFVTWPFAPLSLGTRWDRISRMTVLHVSFRDLAIALAGRSLYRNGRPRSDVAWHCPLVLWWLARPHCAIKRTPLPRGRGLAGGCQTMHFPAWIEARTLRLPGDTAPVELNAHPRVCMIQCTKSVRLTFPVTPIHPKITHFIKLWDGCAYFFIISLTKAMNCLLQEAPSSANNPHSM